MLEKPSHIVSILSKVHFSAWSAEDRKLIEEWLAEDKENQKVLNALLLKEQRAEDLMLLHTLDTAGAWERHKSLLYPKARSKKLYGWKSLISVAASIVCLMGLVYFAVKDRVREQDKPIAEIKPGANQAILRLADGTVVPLGAGEDGVLMNNGLTYEDGAEVAGAEHVNFSSFEMSTPRGGQFRVTLPDGTKVWMNADSKLAYQEDPAARYLNMDGEIYFEVQHKSKTGASAEGKPFVVTANGQKISVLGTHFNVKSYHGDKLSYTTLLEGAVQVSAGKAKLTLVPGEQSVSQAEGLEKRRVDVAAVMAWKEGSFVFNEERLEDILVQVGRWYDVEFIITSDKLKSERFEAFVPRFSQLEELLDVLEKTGKLKFKYSDRTIYVKEK